MSDRPAVHFRFKDADQHKAIVEEAKAQGRSLNNYMMYLIATHPDRAKKKGKR